MTKLVHPSQAALFERLDSICSAIDECIETIAGQRFGFVLAIVAAEPEYAGMTVTNAEKWPAAFAQLQIAIDALKEKHK